MELYLYSRNTWPKINGQLWFITPISGVITLLTLLITSRGPPCIDSWRIYIHNISPNMVSWHHIHPRLVRSPKLLPQFLDWEMSRASSMQPGSFFFKTYIWCDIFFGGEFHVRWKVLFMDSKKSKKSKTTHIFGSILRDSSCKTSNNLFFDGLDSSRISWPVNLPPHVLCHQKQWKQILSFG